MANIGPVASALGLDCTDLRSDGDHTTLRIERQWYRGTLKPNAKTEAGNRTIDLDADLAAKLWAHSASEIRQPVPASVSNRSRCGASPG